MTTGSGLAVAADGSYSIVRERGRRRRQQRDRGRTVTVDEPSVRRASRRSGCRPTATAPATPPLLSFRLTRAAQVGLTIARPGGAVVRRVSLGSLGSGLHTWNWNGKDASGNVVSDGAYACTLAATNAIGTVGATLNLHVDTLAPVAAWRSVATTMKLGKTLHAWFRIADQQSPRLSATIVARTAAGATVRSATLPVVPRGALRSWSFKPKARGRYSLTLRALDLAGNRQVVVARLTVRVT